MAAKLQGTIGLDLSNFEKNLARANRSVSTFSRNAGRSIANINRGFSQMGMAVRGLVSPLLRVGTILAGIGAAGATSMVLAASKFEDLRTTLEIVTGSAENSNRIWQEMFDLFAKTPMNLEELVKLRTLFEGFGIRGVEAVTAVADAASALGRNLEDVGSAVISLETEPLRRMGIQIKALENGARLFNFQLKDGSKQPHYAENFEEAQKAMTAILQAKFGGAAAAQAKLFSGALSTLKGNLFGIAAAIGKIGTEKLTAGIIEMNNKLLVFMKSDRIKDVANAFGQVFDAVASIGNIILDSFNLSSINTTAVITTIAKTTISLQMVFANLIDVVRAVAGNFQALFYIWAAPKAAALIGAIYKIGGGLLWLSRVAVFGTSKAFVRLFEQLSLGGKRHVWGLTQLLGLLGKKLSSFSGSIGEAGGSIQLLSRNMNLLGKVSLTQLPRATRHLSSMAKAGYSMAYATAAIGIGLGGLSLGKALGEWMDITHWTNVAVQKVIHYGKVLGVVYQNMKRFGTLRRTSLSRDLKALKDESEFRMKILNDERAANKILKDEKEGLRAPGDADLFDSSEFERKMKEFMDKFNKVGENVSKADAFSTEDAFKKGDRKEFAWVMPPDKEANKKLTQIEKNTKISANADAERSLDVFEGFGIGPVFTEAMKKLGRGQGGIVAGGGPNGNDFTDPSKMSTFADLEALKAEDMKRLIEPKITSGINAVDGMTVRERISDDAKKAFQMQTEVPFTQIPNWMIGMKPSEMNMGQAQIYNRDPFAALRTMENQGQFKSPKSYTDTEGIDLLKRQLAEQEKTNATLEKKSSTGYTPAFGY